MSKRDKLLERLQEKQSDFTYDEAKTLLAGYGYKVDNSKTSGSRVAFVNVETKHIIRLHKPNPGNVLKKYQIDQLIEELENQGVIKE